MGRKKENKIKIFKILNFHFHDIEITFKKKRFWSRVTNKGKLSTFLKNDFPKNIFLYHKIFSKANTSIICIYKYLSLMVPSKVSERSF